MKRFPLPGIEIFQTDREDGSVENAGDWLKVATQNKIETTIVVEANQVHSNAIEVITNTPKTHQKITATDGLVTNQKHIMLMIKTADCIPLILFNQKAHTIAAIHAGWKGLVGGIVDQAVLTMRNMQNKTEDISVFIGPAIRTCCYQFDQKPTQANLPDWKRWIVEKNQKWQIDLVGFLKMSLEKNGVVSRNITDSKICTGHEASNFSYTRFKQTNQDRGLMATIVQLT